MSTRPGLGLIELVVAMTVFCVGLLGLAGVAALTARELNRAASLEAAAEMALSLADSLRHAHAISPGERVARAATATWSVRSDSTGRTLVIRMTTPYVPPLSFEVLYDAVPR